MSIRSVIAWAVFVGVIIWAGKNPAGSAHAISDGVDRVVTFFTNL